jgi:hypothetical protein
MTARLLQCPAALEHHQFEYNQQRVNRCSARSVRVCVRKAGRTAAWGCLRDAQHRSTCHTYTFTNIYKQQASAQLVSGINTSGACAVLCRTAPGGRAEPHVLWSKVEPLSASAGAAQAWKMQASHKTPTHAPVHPVPTCTAGPASNQGGFPLIYSRG